MKKVKFDAFQRTVLVGCGAIGTALYRRAPSAETVETLNLSEPELVRGLYRQYLEAGARTLTTNTFAANPRALAEIGQADLCADINAAGVELARQAADGQAYVFASVGPLGLGLASEDYSDATLLDTFLRQCDALQRADALLFETFTDPREARLALSAGSRIGLPIVFQIGNVGGGLGRGERIRRLADLASGESVVALGANCQHPGAIEETLDILTACTALPVTVAPNAGHPAIVRGVAQYDLDPQDFARIGARLAARGAALVGGCCGTEPRHIRALAAAIAGKTVAPRRPRELVVAAVKTPPPPAALDVNPIRRLLQRKTAVVSVEIRAERNQTLPEILAGANLVRDAGADLFDVPDNPGATVGRDAAVVAAALQKQLGVPALAHMAVTQSNLLQIHSRLLGGWDLDLRGLLAVTGDSPSMGHLASLAKRVGDVKSSLELLRLIRNMREGRMINGEKISDAPDYCAGCAVGQASQAQLRWLAAKAEAGAEFVFSQPVFSMEQYERLRDGVAPLDLPFFPGLLPLASLRNARFFAEGRIPGIQVPASLLADFERYADAADQRKFGLDLAHELAAAMIAAGRRLYLIMPFGRHACREAAALVRTAKSAGGLPAAKA